MARRTPNLNLYVWDLGVDKYSHTELAYNWDTIDEKVWTSIMQFEILPSVPTTGNFPGRLVMLSAFSGGFPPWVVIRYDGTNWRTVGSVEIQSSLPTVNNYAGRLVLVPAASGYPAWSLWVYGASGWEQMGRLENKFDGASVGTRRNINFLTGEGINVDIVDDPDNNRVNITFSSVAEALITARKDGNTVGQRRALNFNDTSSVSIDVNDDSTNSVVNLTINADITPSSSTVPALIDYVEYNPSSMVIKEINYVPPKEQESLPPSQSFLHRYYYYYRHHRYDNFAESSRPKPIIINGRPYRPPAPNQVTNCNPIMTSTVPEAVDGSLETTFVVPDSGKVMVVLSAIVKTQATSPRVILSPRSKFLYFIDNTRQTQTNANGLPINPSSTPGSEPWKDMNGTPLEGVIFTIQQQINSGTLPWPVSPGVDATNPGAVLEDYIARGLVKTVKITSQAALYADMSDCQTIWMLMEGDEIVFDSEVAADLAGKPAKTQETAISRYLLGGSIPWPSANLSEEERTTTSPGIRETAYFVFGGLDPGVTKTWKWYWRLENPYERAKAKAQMFIGGDAGPASIEVWAL